MSEEHAIAPNDITRTDVIWNLLTNPQNDGASDKRWKYTYIIHGSDGSLFIYHSKNEIRRFLHKKVPFDYALKYKKFVIKDIVYTLEIKEL